MESKNNSNTIIDIAKLANVSTATVSRVINDPKVVKEETRKKVQEVIEKLHYTPNGLARGLITNSTKTIGLMMQDINNMYYPAVIRGVEDEFTENDYGLFICSTDGLIDKEIRHINSLLERRVDGIILLGTRPIGISNNQHILKASKKMPVVTLNDSILGLDIYSVQNEEINGAYEAVKYLINLGHKRIAIINGNGNFTTYVYKQTGYERALLENDIEIKPEYSIKVDPYESGGYEGIQRLLQVKERPTAVLAASDQISIGIYKAIYQSGYRIPDDFSVIGFGGIALANELYPGLTTVNQFPYELGRTAARMIVNVLSGKEIDNKQEIIDCELILRNSCRNIK